MRPRIDFPAIITFLAPFVTHKTLFPFLIVLTISTGLTSKKALIIAPAAKHWTQSGVQHTGMQGAKHRNTGGIFSIFAEIMRQVDRAPSQNIFWHNCCENFISNLN
jgi:hypothetical protein